jgi:UTP--glucose-1-phosphate uridylyltransferase
VPLGLGHAVWCARELVGKEPFALLLPDMVSYGARGCIAGLMELYDEVGGNILGVEECSPEETSSYGIVGVGSTVSHGFSVTEMVEKPEPSKAPSNYYLNGRYILQPEIFDILAKQERGAGNEIQLTDGMKRLAETQPFHGQKFIGRTFDCGSKQGFIAANVAFSLMRSDMEAQVLASIKELVLNHESRVKAA